MGNGVAQDRSYFDWIELGWKALAWATVVMVIPTFLWIRNIEATASAHDMQLVTVAEKLKSMPPEDYRQLQDERYTTILMHQDETNRRLERIETILLGLQQ